MVPRFPVNRELRRLFAKVNDLVNVCRTAIRRILIFISVCAMKRVPPGWPRSGSTDRRECIAHEVPLQANYIDMQPARPHTQSLIDL